MGTEGRSGLDLWGIRFRPPPPDWDACRLLSGLAGRPGLYVHVPFCSRICPFCPYNKVPFDPRSATDYIGQLRRELESHLAQMSEPFTSLYVGGGTPTLCLKSLDFLAAVPVAGERAMEVLPSHMTPRMAALLRSGGFDSVSIGAQSFHDGVLRHLQRPTDAATNRRAVGCAREHFDCVDVDLIFDVAYDGPGTLLTDLAEAFSFGVDQVSTYPLMRFGYTPFGKAAHERRAEHDALRAAGRLAEDSGYRRESVWTFVRDGSPRYTSITRPYDLGIGAGAASFTGEVFAVNHFGLRRYGEAVSRGALPTALVASLPRPAAAAYRAFWQGYTGSFPDRGDPLLSARWLASGLRAAAAAGLVEPAAGGGYRMTPRGYDLYHDAERLVTYRLIEPLWGHLMAEHRETGAAPAAS